MNKVRILRDLEYVNGGLVAMKTLCNKDDKSQIKYYDLLDDWVETIYNVIDQIAKEQEEDA